MELSLLSLFLQATDVVRGVMVLLLAASVYGLALILEKGVVLAKLRRQAAAFLRMGEGKPPPSPAGLCQEIVRRGIAEAHLSFPGETVTERNSRVVKAMRDAIVDEIVAGEARLGNLATIGSVSPFVGLFGTVWGIMHSFLAIAHANDTSLAVVAPGIAEALSTTAIGLVAAIPASVGYNKLVSGFNAVAHRLTRAADRFARRLVLGDDIAEEPVSLGRGR